MPNVTKQVRLYVARHRRRHGDSPTVYVYPPFTNIVSGTYHDQATHTVPYDFGNGEVDCPFLFWSVTMPGDSRVQTALHLDETITSDATVTAWYAPPGGDGPGGPAIIVDAFDASVGDFVDDDFIDVVSDASLTAAANLDGWIPTASAERAVARGALANHPGDPFDTWILDTTGVSAAGTEIDAAAQAGGFAFADYRQPAHVVVPNPREYESFITILAGIINDGPGIYIGPDGKLHPWPGPEPFFKELVSAMGVYNHAKGLDESARGQVQRLAAQVMIRAGEQALKQAGAAALPTQQVAGQQATAGV